MASIIDEKQLAARLQLETKAAVHAEMAKVADAACEKLRKRILAQADALALSILREYSVSRNGSDVLITVKKLA